MQPVPRTWIEQGLRLQAVFKKEEEKKIYIKFFSFSQQMGLIHVWGTRL